MYFVDGSFKFEYDWLVMEIKRVDGAADRGSDKFYHGDYI